MTQGSSLPNRRIAVIGQGYVGLPLAQAAVRAGHTVIGYDTAKPKVAALAHGESPIDDVDNDALRGMLESGRYTPTSRALDLALANTYIIAVPTPLHEGRPDLSAVLSAAETIRPYLVPGDLVVLESTVAPGTTAGEFRAALQDNPGGLRAGAGGFLLGFSPERIDPGNTRWSLHTTPKLTSGIDSASAAAVKELYATMCTTVVPCPTLEVAEMAKLLENTFRHVNIALVNETARHAQALGINIWDVITAAATKPYGFMPFWPGPGVGGHCLPVDPVYLSDRVERAAGRPFRIIDLAMEVNDGQPGYVVDRAARLLNLRRQAMNGSTVLLLGAAYKAGTGDLRETPANRIIALLQEQGAQVVVADPHIAGGELREFPGVKVIGADDAASTAGYADLTILVTDHPQFPYAEIVEAAPLILDTRNKLPRVSNVYPL